MIIINLKIEIEFIIYITDWCFLRFTQEIYYMKNKMDFLRFFVNYLSFCKYRYFSQFFLYIFLIFSFWISFETKYLKIIKIKAYVRRILQILSKFYVVAWKIIYNPNEFLRICLKIDGFKEFLVVFEGYIWVFLLIIYYNNFITDIIFIFRGCFKNYICIILMHS